MNVQDLILETFEYKEGEEVSINEDLIPITPFLAYASFKKKTFGKLKDKLVDFKKAKSDYALSKKADALIKREKARASVGKKSGKGDDATVYKLTKEQMNVMADIYSRHGKKIAKDIMEFRKNILAPYSLIKRKVKEASRVTNKDKFGMTHAEFKVYLESGRKKIENRGEKFYDKSEELRDRINRIDDQIDLLEKAKEKLEDGKDFPSSILNRLYKKYNVHDADLLGYPAQELRNAQNNLEKQISRLKKDTEEIKSEGLRQEHIDDILSGVVRKDISSEKEDKEKEKEGERKRRGSFNIALGRYLFRREILDSLRAEEENSYKRAYYEIVKDMILALIEEKKNTTRKLRSLNDSINLNDKEKLIWKKRPTASSFSNDLNDYYQAIKDEDFLKAPIYIERSDDLKEAEQKIENEIKRFERSLKKKIGEKDFAKLKQYRLINNLISVRDLKSPKDLFKNTSEIMSTTNATRDDLEKSDEYISPQDFERRIWFIHNYTYSSVAELNNAKKEVEDLVEKMKKQGDSRVVEKLDSVIDRIKIRRTLEPQRNSYIDRESKSSYYVSIDDVRKKAEEISNKDYDSANEFRRDKDRLDLLVRSFKENNGERAEQELARIDFLFNKIERKANW